MSVSLLLFDLDETIAPDEETNRILMADIVADLVARYGAPLEHLPAAIGRAAAALWERGAAAAYSRRIGISAWEGLWGPFGPSRDPNLAALHAFAPAYRLQAWARALAACGVADEEVAAATAERFAAERQARQAPYPWSRAVLERLRPRFRVGMITNGAPDLQRLKLMGTGLAERFDPLVVSGDLGIGKPEPAIFLHALAQAGAAPSEAIMVGDSWHRDVLGATAAGLRAVWINPTGAPRPASDHAISSIFIAPDLRTLPGLLGERSA
jgi:putative hydrolase of the HAD superfamily